MAIMRLAKCATRIRAHAIAWQREVNRNRRRLDYLLPAALVTVCILSMTGATYWLRDLRSLRQVDTAIVSCEAPDKKNSPALLVGTWKDAQELGFTLEFTNDGNLRAWRNDRRGRRCGRTDPCRACGFPRR